jgi:CubicO group peptidase (beta-lactamase class C family)
MAGIPRDFEPLDEQLDATNSRKLGFPPSELSDLEKICGNVSMDRAACTPEVFTENLAREHPIDAPWQQPLYSNGAYQLLTFAFENMTNTSFPQALQTFIFNPLNMTDSYSSLPPSAAPGLIPLSITDSAWNQTFNQGGAEGGMYSSAADLVKLGQSIMNHTLLSPTDTRRWLKPLSHTACLRYSVGMPWEIYRRPPLPNGTLHSVDLFNKAGDIGLYHANFALIPAYSVGYTLLGGNNNGSVLALDDGVVDGVK